MTIRFIARRMSGGNGHEHIASLKWTSDESGETKTSTRETLVDWINNKNGQGYVLDAAGNKAWVGVVDASPPYLRTYADRKWTDNLLALPTY